MERLGRIVDPVVIKLSHLGNKLLPLNGIEEEVDFSKDNGVVLGGEHIGFIIISDSNKTQKEDVYYTDNRITAIGITDGQVYVYEDNKRTPWVFSIKGDLLSENKPKESFGVIKRDVKIDTEGHLLQNDKQFTIVFDSTNHKNYILFVGKEYPLEKGMVFGGDVYGINIKNISEDGEVETGYHTADSLYGVEYDYSTLEPEIRVFEKDKYNPWRFGEKGRLKTQASYNPYSRQDGEAYEEKYGKKLRPTNN